MKDLIIWILGYYPFKRKNKSKDGALTTYSSTGDVIAYIDPVELYPKSLWRFSFTKDFHLSIYTPKGPCFIHRWMQKLILGIYWRRIYDI